MIRLLQNILLVIGATAAGATLCSGIAFLGALAVFPSGRDAGGAVVAFLILAILGAVFGAISGFVGSIRWITQRPTKPWPLTTWIGVVVGFALGLAVRVSAVLDGNVLGNVIAWWPGTMIFLAANAFFGGLIGGIAARRGKNKISQPPGRLN